MGKSDWVLCAMLFIGLWSIPAQTEWSITQIESALDAGQNTALRVDQNDFPHIAYQCEDTNSLKYAYYYLDHWNHEDPAGTTGMGFHCSLVLDHLDAAHIAHFDPDNNDLAYTYRNGSNWQTVIADSPGNVGLYCSIDLDSNGYPSISYYDETRSAIACATKLSAGWTIRYALYLVYPTCTVLKIDSADKFHICFSDYATGTLMIATYNGTEWSTGTLATGVQVTACDMELDSNDFEHIMYIDAGSTNLRYVFHSDLGWQTETVVENASGALKSVSYRLDSSGGHHVCYYDLNMHLSYAWLDGGTWHTEVVDTDGDVGFSCSLDLDSQNLAHISYYDMDRKDPRYARQLPSPTPTPGPQEITYQLVMADPYITAGETFLLERTWENTTSSTERVDEYILLDIAGMYWFWPAWSENVNFSTWTAQIGGPFTDSILTFEWPAVTGSFTGIRFWGAFLRSGTTDLIAYHMIEWGYGETPPGLAQTSIRF